MMVVENIIKNIDDILDLDSYAIDKNLYKYLLSALTCTLWQYFIIN